MRCSEDAQDNLNRAEGFIRDAARAGAQLVCLPELFLSPYFCKTEDHAFFALAEPIPHGPTTARMEALSRELGVSLLVSLFEKRTEGLYHNTMAVIDPKAGYMGKYRKMHIPDDPLFMEKFYFTPGDLGFKVFHTAGISLGTLICWDQWYPEAARLTAMKGAHVLFYPTAIGWLPEEKNAFGAAQHESWELSQRAHAIANGVFVCSVNRIGFEPIPQGPEGSGIEFWGQSFICGPDGAFLAKASSDQEELLIADLDFNLIDGQRTTWPFFRDRRIDAYDGLARRFLDD